MDLSHAMTILEIEQGELKNVTLKYLKRRYHKLALQSHPDKNGNTIESKEKFQLLGEAYDILKREISILDTDVDTDTPEDSNINTQSYSFFVNLFIDGLLHGKYNEFISIIVKDIVSGAKKVSFKLFENLDKERALYIYHFLFKYQTILNISSEELTNLQDLISEKYKDIQIYILNPSITDLFETNIYILNQENVPYYVPLWHSELMFDGINGKEIIVKCNPDLPENISIDENNNLIIIWPISFTFSLLSKKYETIIIESKTFAIPIDELLCKHVQTYVFKGQGIPKICEQDMYNVTDLADIIIKIVFRE